MSISKIYSKQGDLYYEDTDYPYTYDVRAFFEQYMPLDKFSILDFGCNTGNFIKFRDHKNYTGIDIQKHIIEHNKIAYPQHTWLHYNGYSRMYNPEGTEKLRLSENDRYDVCLAFSVFTHIPITEQIEIIDVLKKHCKTIMMSFNSTSDTFHYENICSLVGIDAHNIRRRYENNGTGFCIQKKNKLWTFHNPEHLKKYFGAHIIETTMEKDEITGHQWLAVINN
mgnify:CR=1 FL=1